MAAIGKSAIYISFICCLFLGGASGFTAFSNNECSLRLTSQNSRGADRNSPDSSQASNGPSALRESAFAQVRRLKTNKSQATAVSSSKQLMAKQQRGYQYGFGGRRGRSTEIFDFNEMDRFGVPDWEIDNKFKYDEFRFVRVKYRSIGYSRYGAKWRIDYPDSDLNFSFRLQQLTSLKVNPDPIVLELTDEKILDYPFMYLIEPGDIDLTDEEVQGMRRYLNNGGFIMVDDFWSDFEWYALEEQMKKVLPGKRYVELDLDHPIFSCVYDLKTKPQCPAIGNYERSGFTTDRPYDPTARDPHYRAYFDDNDRMCMIACHNTDLGDGWEREGESEFYFKRFSEKEAYPMGINIVVYAMTH